ncbi:peroxiredoxin-like family protein [Flavobacterium sp.]|uniref:peroxiredoxin-like family protein n=1 Tax=Flavobacterium sp. TaxID=239 RepID=UPI002B4B70CF|nr:peroxiredoxin-like family protein [Flavobacterium sp.]HLP64955.1 peroxiredoxin-like family protein [Flavobacterium sp.]
MKKLLIATFVLVIQTLSAQNDLPKTAFDVSPLLIGEKIPMMTLTSSENKKIDLSSVLLGKKTILVFYRGGWCPYCNVQLSALSEAESELLLLGYQLVAVSPDAPKQLQSTTEKEKLKYTLLSDSKGEFSKAVGIAFQSPENYLPIITKGSDGLNQSFLPVPTVLIIDKDGSIKFEHITPDFKNRISSELLLSAAKALK